MKFGGMPHAKVLKSMELLAGSPTPEVEYSLGYF